VSIGKGKAWQRRDPEEIRGVRTHLLAILNVLPIVSVIGIILIGIYTGWATPTEVAALGVIVAVVVAAVTGTLSFPMLRDAVYSSVRFTAVIVFVLIGATIFSYSLTMANAPQMVSAYVGSLSIDPIMVILAIILMYVILGTFMESLSMMIMTVSIVFPLITSLGFDPVWFGIVMVMVLEIGLLTPPIGMNLFAIQAVAPPGTNFWVVAKGSMPFVALMLVGVVFLLMFPQIALWLPSQMFR